MAAACAGVGAAPNAEAREAILKPAILAFESPSSRPDNADP